MTPLAIGVGDIVLATVGALIGLAVTLPVTYLVVDRIIEHREKKRLEPIERMAKERLRSKLGVGSLTTLLITLSIDVRASVDQKKAMTKEVSQMYITRLRTFQSDLETLLGVYKEVLSIEISRVTGEVIAQVEHLQEDIQYLIELHPRHTTETHVDHIEHLILLTVQLAKRELDMVGGANDQINALESWLVEEGQKHVHPKPEEPIEVSGKHTLM
jgi:hypothetical protein